MTVGVLTGLEGKGTGGEGTGGEGTGAVEGDGGRLWIHFSTAESNGDISPLLP